MTTEALQLDREQQDFIALNLRRLLELNKKTETKVAQDLGIPVMTIRRLLSGETTDPRVFTLKTIADYFQVSVDHLIESNDISSHAFIGQTKPLFVPILDWDSAKNIEAIDLKKWNEWIPVSTGKSQSISLQAFALESRPSMYPRFQHGTLFILDPLIAPSDGDLVLVHLKENHELTLRELFIDPPTWQLHPISQGAPLLEYSKEAHEIVGVVLMTLFYNRKQGSK